ncbi:MAG: phosphohydrolase [Caulobacter sp.]|nr:phosphohydrolase [Caulobacter sp.]
MTPALEAAYAEPHRRYHSRAHIESCLALLGEQGGLSTTDRQILEYAIWWHDAVYDPTRSDNEDASAVMARRDLLAMGMDPVIAGEVARLILLTKGHVVSPGDRLAALMVSIDLAILGAEPAAYDAYAADVRQEYAHVPDPLFQAGRVKVMRRFLDADAIFPDLAFRARLESPARANITRELQGLAASVTTTG